MKGHSDEAFLLKDLSEITSEFRSWIERRTLFYKDLDRHETTLLAHIETHLHMLADNGDRGIPLEDHLQFYGLRFLLADCLDDNQLKVERREEHLRAAYLIHSFNAHKFPFRARTSSGGLVGEDNGATIDVGVVHIWKSMGEVGIDDEVLDRLLNSRKVKADFREKWDRLHPLMQSEKMEGCRCSECLGDQLGL